MAKIQIVDNVKTAWRWFSVQAMALAGAIQGAWLFMPEDLKTSIPSNWVQYLTIVLLALGIVGRVVKQGTA